MTTAIRPAKQKIAELTASVIGDLKLKRVAIEAHHLTLASFAEIESQCKSAQCKSAQCKSAQCKSAQCKSAQCKSAQCKAVQWAESTGVVEQMRQIKDESEIRLIRSAVEIAERAFTKTLAGLTPETTERDFALDLETAMRRDSADGVSFDIIAGFGETGALPHYFPANRSLGDHSTLLIDWGACYQGYASDISRTLHRKNASDRFKTAYEAVLEAQEAAIAAIRPGIECAAVDAIAREVLDQHGLADAFLHSLGHGIGLNIHEGPRLGENSSETLQAGMVVTVEPGVYLEGDFGIRIEDDILVTQSGHELLTTLPKGLDDCRLML